MTKAGQQQRKREEAGAGDSLQLLEGKLEWWKPLDSHPKVFWLGLHPVSLDDLPFLLLILPLSNSSASNPHISFLLSLSQALRGPAGQLWVQPPCQTLLPNVLSPCPATTSQSLLFQLSNALFHQPADSSSAFQGRQRSSLSCLCVTALSSLPTRFSLFFRDPHPNTCFFAFFIFRCPIGCSWTRGREPSRLMLELWLKFFSEYRQCQQWVWGLES